MNFDQIQEAVYAADTQSQADWLRAVEFAVIHPADYSEMKNTLPQFHGAEWTMKERYKDLGGGRYKSLESSMALVTPSREASIMPDPDVKPGNVVCIYEHQEKGYDYDYLWIQSRMKGDRDWHARRSVSRREKTLAAAPWGRTPKPQEVGDAFSHGMLHVPPVPVRFDDLLNRLLGAGLGGHPLNMEAVRRQMEGQGCGLPTAHEVVAWYLDRKITLWQLQMALGQRVDFIEPRKIPSDYNPSP